MTFSCDGRGIYLVVSHSPNLLGRTKGPMGIQFICIQSDQPWCEFSVVTLFSTAKELPVLFEAPSMLLMSGRLSLSQQIVLRA